MQQDESWIWSQSKRRLGWRIVRDGDLQRERPGEGGARGDVASRKRHQAGRTPGRFGHGGVDMRYPLADGDEDTDGLSVPVGEIRSGGDDHVALLMIRRTSWGRCVARPRENLPGVAVELDAGKGIFTTLPVVPVQKLLLGNRAEVLGLPVRYGRL